MARQKSVVLKRHANGLIAVEQEGIGGWTLTYNPDDERLYIHAPNSEADVQTTYASDERGLANARYWMRKHKVEETVG